MFLPERRGHVSPPRADAAVVHRFARADRLACRIAATIVRWTPPRFAPADVVARRVLVDNGGRPLPVQPLHEIDTTDRHAARVLRLLREQAQDTHG
jgi:hypothetical protein